MLDTPSAIPVQDPALAATLAHFNGMVDRCYDYAEAARNAGRPIVGIMCEFTPRELILAAGGVPVCLCGGSAATIPAAEQVLPSNLCPLIKSTFGYHLTGRNPFLQWADLVVAETTCDGKKKMFELMGETKPMHVLELPHRALDPDALASWTSQVRKLLHHLEQRFNVRITDADLRKAIQLMNRERQVRRDLASLMALDTPPFTGRQLLEFKSIISGIEADLAQLESLLHHCRQLPRPAVASASPPVRVLLTGVPLAHGAERVLDLIEGAGAIVVAMENCTGLKPILEDVDAAAPDPVAAIAAKYYHLPCSVMTPNSSRFTLLRSLAETYRPECIIDLVWHACLTYDIESYQVRRLAEDQLHLPYLKLTTDYAPADSARLSARIEALLETTRARRTPQPAVSTTG